jgi:DNA-directed RNA polymerase subunit H (RpoH/RPB5)
MLIALLSLALMVGHGPAGGQAASPARPPAAKQLAAVRGEVVKISAAGRGMLLITVRPARDYAEVTVLARENDLVGSGVGREGGADLLGLLADDARDDETITAAELSQGDVVSVIYDPQAQNRVLEIYMH